MEVMAKVEIMMYVLGAKGKGKGKGGGGGGGHEVKHTIISFGVNFMGH